MNKLAKLIFPLFLAVIISCSQNNSENSQRTSAKPKTLEKRIEQTASQRYTGTYKKMKNYFSRERAYEVDIGQGEKLRFIEITSEPQTLIETNSREYLSSEEQAESDNFNKVSPFAIMETELTWKQFKVFLDETDYAKNGRLDNTYARDFKEQGMNPQLPITGISTYNANDFCEWLQNKVNAQYPGKDLKVKLPTPAQFAYAMAEKKNLKEFMERRITSKKANIKDNIENSGKQMKPVKSYPPNSLGLYDMIGNAEEYVLCLKYDEAMSMGGRYSDEINEEKEDKVYKRLHYERRSSYMDSAFPWSNVGFRPVLNIK